MSTVDSEYRLDGIYKQRQEGYYMQRVELPAGVVSAGQARAISVVSTRFGQSTIHLTTRGSQGAQGFPSLKSLVHRLHRHFTDTPRFDLYRRADEGLGTAVERSLTLDELYGTVREIG